MSTSSCIFSSLSKLNSFYNRDISDFVASVCLYVPVILFETNIEGIHDHYQYKALIYFSVNSPIIGSITSQLCTTEWLYMVTYDVIFLMFE